MTEKESLVLDLITVNSNFISNMAFNNASFAFYSEE